MSKELTNELLEKMNYIYVRIDNEDNSKIYKQMNDTGFTMVNIDVDMDKIPFALFIKDEFTKKKIIEYFVTYKQGKIMNSRLVKEHPVEWMNTKNIEIEARNKSKKLYAFENPESKKKPMEKKYHIIFYKEVYNDLKNLDNLRF